MTASNIILYFFTNLVHTWIEIKDKSELTPVTVFSGESRRRKEKRIKCTMYGLIILFEFHINRSKKTILNNSGSLLCALLGEAIVV